jgi:signal transduction histidine kinase
MPLPPSDSERIDPARAVFLADLAHDLSAPLTAIHGAVELLLAGIYGSLANDQRMLLVEMLASAGELRGLVQDVADLGALDGGRLILAAEPFELAPVIEELRGSFADIAARRSLTFSLAVSLGVEGSGVIVGDMKRVRQIVAGVCLYALKASRRGSEVSVTVVRAGDQVRLDVRSTGITATGDPAALFDDYRALTPGVPKPYRGPGLGLPLVARLVDACGGRVLATADGALTLGVELPVDRHGTTSRA